MAWQCSEANLFDSETLGTLCLAVATTAFSPDLRELLRTYRGVTIFVNTVYVVH